MGIRDSHHGSNGCDIGHRRRSSIDSLYIVVMVRPLTEAPEMLIVVVKAMMLWAIPAIGIPMRVVKGSIWIGLSAQGA